MLTGSGSGGETIRRASLTVAVHGEQWLTERENEGCSRSTANTYRYGLRYFSRFLHAIGEPWEAVTKGTVQQWSTEMRLAGLSSKTRRERVNVVRFFFGWLHENKYVPENPLLYLKPIKAQRRLPVPLSPNTIRKLSHAAPTHRDRAIVETLYASGGRRDEVLGLDLTDVDYEAGTILIRHGKGGKERLQVVTPKCLSAIKAWISERPKTDETALFTSRQGRLKRSQLQVILDKLGDLAGVGHIHPHQFRHALGTRLINQGMDIREVQNVLGHESIRSTELYTHVAKDKLRKDYLKAMEEPEAP